MNRSIPLLAAALFAVLPACRPGQGGAGPEPGAGEPGVVFASIDMTCGSRTITVNTGTGGDCESTEGPKGSGITCTDGKGNGGSAGCIDGVAKCFESSGKGSCSIKSIQ